MHLNSVLYKVVQYIEMLCFDSNLFTLKMNEQRKRHRKIVYALLFKTGKEKK